MCPNLGPLMDFIDLSTTGDKMFAFCNRYINYNQSDKIGHGAVAYRFRLGAASLQVQRHRPFSGQISRRYWKE
jgi:hypothetical protein